jgi:uncharacterized membrane-anchored protein YhcB (DUF1043 family)
MEEPKTESKTETDQLHTLWQEYLQKCCEDGQLNHQLEQLESQRKEIQKNQEVTRRMVKSLASKHRELKKSLASKVQMPKPEVETKEAH